MVSQYLGSLGSPDGAAVLPVIMLRVFDPPFQLNPDCSQFPSLPCCSQKPGSQCQPSHQRSVSRSTRQPSFNQSPFSVLNTLNSPGGGILALKKLFFQQQGMSTTGSLHFDSNSNNMTFSLSRIRIGPCSHFLPWMLVCVFSVLTEVQVTLPDPERPLV